MAEKVTFVTPLYSPGVHHARVDTPESGSAPDPLGILDPIGTQVPHMTAGGGDEVNDWSEQFPDGGKG